MSGAIDLEALHAPTLSDFETLAAKAYARLPEAFRAQCGDLAILVVDWPDEATLEALEIDDAYDLLGLYEGVDLTMQDTLGPVTDVNRVFLYRRPIIDYWAEYADTLGHLVTHVLIHEIGHHFGLSDAEMEAIEAAAD